MEFCRYSSHPTDHPTNPGFIQPPKPTQTNVTEQKVCCSRHGLLFNRSAFRLLYQLYIVFHTIMFRFLRPAFIVLHNWFLRDLKTKSWTIPCHLIHTFLAKCNRYKSTGHHVRHNLLLPFKSRSAAGCDEDVAGLGSDSTAS